MTVSRIGVDVGGTFTDVHLISTDGAVEASVKHPTSRPDPTEGIVAALSRLAAPGTRDRALGPGFDPARIEQITVGSTLALNAVLEGRGARTALITTHGFRDVLDIARERRASLYDLQQVVGASLVPRQLRFEVRERVGARGEVITPLCLHRDGPPLLAALDASGARAVAICLLNSYAFAEHEQRLRELLQERRPELFVCASVTVSRQYREYERTLVTCVNAYVGPVMADYLRRLETALARIAPGADVRITDSVGGAMNLAAAGDRPVLTVMSGPASGAAGLAAVSEQARRAPGGGDLAPTVIGMDMGGTSCDVTVVDHGRPDLAATVTVGEHRFALPTVDIHSIGAGGGTLAWVDDGGLLRVGPRSAGSDPGPACYGRGGAEPTITDAHLVLGHLAPDIPLGERIRLDENAANNALGGVADRLGMSVRDAARGVLRVADASMRRAVEAITVRRGLDPRTCTLVAYGGAAPLHATGIAAEMGIATTLIPRCAGVLSAMGAVWAPEHYEATRAVLEPTWSVRRPQLTAWVDELAATARSRAGTARPLTREVSFDMRFVGQTSALRVPVHDPSAPDAARRAHREFTALYHRVFGYVLPDTESEVENVRVRLTVRASPPAPAVAGAAGAPARPRGWRAVFAGAGELDCALWVLTGGQAPPHTVAGPAVVVGAGSTALIQPEQVGTLDRHGNLIVRSPDRVPPEPVEAAVLVSTP